MYYQFGGPSAPCARSKLGPEELCVTRDTARPLIGPPNKFAPAFPRTSYESPSRFYARALARAFASAFAKINLHVITYKSCVLRYINYISLPQKKCRKLITSLLKVHTKKTLFVFSVYRNFRPFLGPIDPQGCRGHGRRFGDEKSKMRRVHSLHY